MGDGHIEFLLTKAIENWKNYPREISNRKVIFLIGASGSGKTSVGNAMTKRWEDDKVLCVPEVGGELRGFSASAPEVFEVPFEFATLALEIANMSAITTEDYGNCPLVVDGGIIQNYIYLWKREDNIDSKMRSIFFMGYAELMVQWLGCLRNAYFVLLKHRHRNEFNSSFEEIFYSSMTFLEREETATCGRSAELSSELITHYLQSHDNIPSLENFLDKLGNFVKLS